MVCGHVVTPSDWTSHRFRDFITEGCLGGQLGKAQKCGCFYKLVLPHLIFHQDFVWVISTSYLSGAEDSSLKSALVLPQTESELPSLPVQPNIQHGIGNVALIVQEKTQHM